MNLETIKFYNLIPINNFNYFYDFEFQDDFIRLEFKRQGLVATPSPGHIADLIAEQFAHFCMLWTKTEKTDLKFTTRSRNKD